MDSMYESELVRLGLEAGRQIAGEGAFAHVSVEPGEDWTGQPSYYFEFVISDGYSLNRDHEPGFVATRVGQKVRDLLIERGDEHYPYLHFASMADWQKRAHA